MMPPGEERRNALLRHVLCLVVCLVPGCVRSVPPAPVPAYDYAALTTKLTRGVSDEGNVRAALGTPRGHGELLLPDGNRVQTLYYQNVVAFAAGKEIQLHDDLLLVFLRDGKFDGYLWTSDASHPK
jgi:hypothetical protein